MKQYLATILACVCSLAVVVGAHAQEGQQGAAGGVATVGSKTPGWGWFPCMRAYGAKAEFFDDRYKFPTIRKVKDFTEYIK